MVVESLIKIPYQYLNGLRTKLASMHFMSFATMVVTQAERIYNPITAMGFSAMFIFQLDNTKR